jgi:hypothetical protein
MELLLRCQEAPVATPISRLQHAQAAAALDTASAKSPTFVVCHLEIPFLAGVTGVVGISAARRGFISSRPRKTYRSEATSRSGVSSRHAWPAGSPVSTSTNPTSCSDFWCRSTAQTFWRHAAARAPRPDAAPILVSSGTPQTCSQRRAIVNRLRGVITAGRELPYKSTAVRQDLMVE